MSLESWTTYFRELNDLLVVSERQYGTANVRFAEYMIERFELALQSTTSIIHCLESITLTPNERSSIQDYKESIQQLKNHIRFLLDKWKEYRTLLDSTSRNTCYCTPALHTGRQGRPKFDIEKEQIEYLLSLSFNWIEIASLLCVSRMTLYRYWHIWL